MVAENLKFFLDDIDNIRKNMFDLVKSNTKEELEKEKDEFFIDPEFSKFNLNKNEQILTEKEVNNLNENREIKNEIIFTQRDLKSFYGTVFKEGSENDIRNKDSCILLSDVKQLKDEIDILEKYLKNSKAEISKHIDSNNS